MIFYNPPSQKQVRKLLKNTDNFLPIPDTWEEFVSLTSIRSGGSIRRFEPFDYQKEIIRLGDLYKRVVILKTRQVGVTQTIISKFLYDACKNPAASSVAFMRNGEDASAISRRCRQMLSSIPKYALAENDNVGYLKIAAGGDIYFKNSGSEGSRSTDSVSSFLFDEAAFVPTISSIYAASSPSGAMNEDCIIYVVSTPSAKSGWYWEQVSNNNGNIDIEDLAEAVANNTEYPHEKVHQTKGFAWFLDQQGTCKVVLHYLAHPLYGSNPNFLEEQKLKSGQDDDEKIQREFNLKFVNQAVAVFDPFLVQDCATGAWEDNPEPGAIYYAGLDCSTTGNDYTVLQILKYKNNHFSIVHTYAKRKQTSEYHLLQIADLLNHFGVRKLGIEVTGGVGQLYYEQLSERFKEFAIDFERIKTTAQSKPTMIAGTVHGLEAGLLSYPKQCNIIDEMLSFQRVDNKLGAAEGKHDDEVMALAFAYAVANSEREQQLRELQAYQNLSSKELLKRAKVNEI